jgi:hypothetical protein
MYSVGVCSSFLNFKTFRDITNDLGNLDQGLFTVSDKQMSRWKSQLDTLKAMGFEDTD